MSTMESSGGESSFKGPPANGGAISRQIVEKADHHVEVALPILEGLFAGQSENISWP